MWCIAGLGNPGRKYFNTRHNLGFAVLNQLAQEREICWKYKDNFSYALYPEPPLFLLRPLTYMNLSGNMVRQVLRERNFKTDRLLVVCDDINIPLGQLRLRASGSHGGQKGLKSIIDILKTEDFARLRLGIGPLPPAIQASDFVLGRFLPSQHQIVKEMIQRAAESIIKISNQGLANAMNSINQKNT